MKKIFPVLSKVALAAAGVGVTVLLLLALIAAGVTTDDAFFHDRREFRKAYGVFCEKNAYGGYVTYDAHGNAYTLAQFEEAALDKDDDCWVDAFCYYNADGDRYVFCNANNSPPWFYYRCNETGDRISADEAYVDESGCLTKLPKNEVTVHYRNDVDSSDHDYDYEWYYTDSGGRLFFAPEDCTWDSNGAFMLRFERSLAEIKRDAAQNKLS